MLFIKSACICSLSYTIHTEQFNGKKIACLNIVNGVADDGKLRRYDDYNITTDWQTQMWRIKVMVNSFF